MVKFQPSKLAMWVRFPLPAPQDSYITTRFSELAAMKTFSLLPRTFCAISTLGAAILSAAPCDDISRDVTTAIEKEPGKVLMIVEDALVINEGCACEIIRAAILASKADPTQVNQIVQTAISVAPKMSGVIMDCATSASPGTQITSQAAAATTASGKEVKNPLPTVEPVVQEEEFNPIPSSIRGVYLIQTPGGFLPRPRDKDPISSTVALPFYP